MNHAPDPSRSPIRRASSSPGMRRGRSLEIGLAVGLGLLALAVGPIGSATAQPPEPRVGELVPRDVREMYDRGLEFLARTQTEEGSWAGVGEQGPGVTGMAVLALLASGEDANFGLYSSHVRKGLRSIIEAQNSSTGFFGLSMYHHGFAMLALAEAYGTVDERNLWPDSKAGQRSIGQALELAVRAAITSQKANPTNAWRYQPTARDADTSVSGAVLIGLLAARNAGVEVPDDSIDKAIAYFRSMTLASGDVNYAGMGGMGDSMARSSIATLAYAVARRKDLSEFKATLGYLTQRLEEPPNGYREYVRYYEAQALFQGDLQAWEKWNKLLVRQLKEGQLADGSIRGQFGPTISTSLSLLSLALNYRFLPIYER